MPDGHDDAPTTHEAPVIAESSGVLGRSFLGLLVTQFLGAMNDNIFRWLVVPIGKHIAGPEHAATALSAGLACLVLPFILFASQAGYLADRYSKRRVIVGCKVAEVVIMALGVLAIWLGNVYVLYGVLFLMGTQSAMFSPSKLGSLPELVRSDRLQTANGLIGLSTIAAIMAGSVLGGFLYAWTGDTGQGHLWISAAALLGVAGVGLLTSLMIRPLAVANPERVFPKHPFQQTMRDLGMMWSDAGLKWVALAIAFFWGVGSLFQLNVDAFATLELGVPQESVGPLLAALCLGIGIGSAAAGAISRG
ncbi:MAG: MFS transporter, partial [Planctomycetales bacterium]|nr:MFS transporter [Planctomycetales bacterium]